MPPHPGIQELGIRVSASLDSLEPERPKKEIPELQSPPVPQPRPLTSSGFRALRSALWALPLLQ
jgi:hypothetical protein